MTDPGDNNGLDGALQRLFAGSAPQPTEPASLVLERIGPRLVWARRRRIAGQAATAAALTLGAIGIGVAVFPDRSGPETIIMADGGDSSGSAGTGATGSPKPAVDGESPVPGGTSGSAPATSSTAVTDQSAPTTASESATSSVSTAPGISPSTVASTTTIEVEDTDVLFRSPGGNLTARWSTSEAILVSTDPASGFIAIRHKTGPIEIEVDFYNASTGETRTIDLELVDGELIRHSEDSDNSEDSDHSEDPED